MKQINWRRVGRVLIPVVLIIIIVMGMCRMEDDRLEGMKSEIKEKRDAIREQKRKDNKFLQWLEKNIGNMSDDDLADDTRDRIN